MCDGPDAADREDGTAQALPQAPELEWLEGGIPRSTRFSDTYFSKAGGLAETRHVFLAGNGLPERWHGRSRFVIGELGFGTGLNFLTTLHALGDIVSPPALTFLSFELYPLDRDQLATALAAWPELADEAASLLECWVPEPGWNRLSFGAHELLLGIGDARELIRQASTQTSAQAGAAVDAWFLDGFAPSRNPELWDAGLLAHVAELTADGGTLATYTSAGWVRRNLAAAGFAIEKTRGFAGKREMVVGRKA
ncbi:tRNA (5-methylaminomethyl-2-thiouridine)(34)-methyltransferase MnmD [Roseibium aestuarii]|uniref:tRNA (5-methylaminomethyl-2-thiouridine)(34)-methyltransferase MnmD n=1 Tax=Roseibium aestuarii TaxID=2600299 RepID=A0ABW4JTX1_9HYPH|nr:tRNA (5-methylaminomethyl-2-thiouridine)(34)-methyltransferase MnmD [Roseibium aestuarii]